MTSVYALVLLKDLGVDPAHERVRRAIGLVRDRITWWQLDGRPYFDGETEPCINGAILAAGAYFGAASDRLVDRLLDEQLEDGGWNCQAPSSKRSSFHYRRGDRPPLDALLVSAQVALRGAAGVGLPTERRRQTRRTGC